MREESNFSWKNPMNWIVDKRPEKYSNKRKEIKKTKKKEKRKEKRKEEKKKSKLQLNNMSEIILIKFVITSNIKPRIKTRIPTSPSIFLFPRIGSFCNIIKTLKGFVFEEVVRFHFGKKKEKRGGVERREKEKRWKGKKEQRRREKS